MKRAVILFNLGGPDAPAAVRPFLFNLFNDPAILAFPQPFRGALAWLIAKARVKKAQAIYDKIGGRSPLTELTRAQGKALESVLNMDKAVETRVFIAMRYWHPRAFETVAEVAAFAPDEIVLLPLYPHYSVTTTGSSFAEWDRVARRHVLTPNVRAIRSYPAEANFIAAQADLLTACLNRAGAVPLRVLFSAHGLPQKIIDAGDPYQREIEVTAKAIAGAAGLSAEQWAVCYQSRVGPLKWLEPTLDAELARARRDGVGVAVLPIAFVSEHSETLVELDMDYRERAAKLGVKPYLRVPALGTHPGFIAALADLVQKPSGSVSGPPPKPDPKLMASLFARPESAP